MLSDIYEPDRYEGDGAEDTFEFTHRILQKADLVVNVVDGTTGDVTTLVLDTDYTIDDAFVNADAGGEIVTTDPVADGDFIILIRRTARLQLVNIVEGSPFPAAVVTKVFDRLTMMIQELEYRIRQSLAFADSSAFVDIEVPEPEDETFLGWLNNELANLEVAAATYIGDTENPAQDDEDFAVVFDAALADTTYEVVSVATNWATAWSYGTKLTTGFTITFTNPAPASAELVWRVRV